MSRESKGSKLCKEILLEMKDLTFECEKCPQDIILLKPARYRYDFIIKKGDKKYVLEFDGRFHIDTKSNLYSEEAVMRDKIKTASAIQSGYIVIRILEPKPKKHLTREYIKTHIVEGLKAEKSYYSHSELYVHLKDVEDKNLKQIEDKGWREYIYDSLVSGLGRMILNDNQKKK